MRYTPAIEREFYLGGDMEVKGSLDANNTIKNYSAEHGGCWALYVQEDILNTPSDTRYYLSRWLPLDGGIYELHSFADDYGEIYIDGKLIASVAMTDSVVSFEVSSGQHKIDCYYTNTPANTPSYLMYAIYHTNNPTVPIVISEPSNDWYASDTGWPELPPAPEYDSRFGMPVWLPKPNWREGLVETYGFLTDVMTSETGAEQRRSIRRFPRRTFEATFTRLMSPTHRVEDFDAAIIGIGYHRFLLPLWRNLRIIKSQPQPILLPMIANATLPAGTTVIYGGFANREFDAGFMALIRDAEDHYVYEVVKIAESEPERLVLTSGTQNDYFHGFEIVPLRVFRVKNNAGVTQITSHAQEAKVIFESDEPNDWPQADWHFPLNDADDIPIWTKHPDWSSGIKLTYERLYNELDNMTGVKHAYDYGNQAHQSISFDLMYNGEQEEIEFRDMLWAALGRLRMVYVPTYNSDMTLVDSVAEGDTFIKIRMCGYTTMSNNMQNIRKRIFVRLRTDEKFRVGEIIQSRIDYDQRVEYVYLATPIGPIDINDVIMISFMPLCRLDHDDISLNHLAAIGGTITSTITFKALPARRNI